MFTEQEARELQAQHWDDQQRADAREYWLAWLADQRDQLARCPEHMHATCNRAYDAIERQVRAMGGV